MEVESPRGSGVIRSGKVALQTSRGTWVVNLTGGGYEEVTEVRLPAKSEGGQQGAGLGAPGWGATADAVVDYGSARDIGKGVNEGGAFRASDADARASRLALAKEGDSFLGNDKGVNLISEVNEQMYAPAESVQVLAVIHGRVGEVKDSAMVRKKWFDASTKSRKGWEECMRGLEVAYDKAKRALERQNSGMGVGAGASLAVQLCYQVPALQVLEKDFQLYSAIDAFVKREFDKGNERQVLEYMKFHWELLKEAWATYGGVSVNRVIMAQQLINVEFVSSKCIDMPLMFRTGLIGAGAASAPSGRGSGGGGGRPAGQPKAQTPASRGSAPQNPWGPGAPDPIYGFAPRLKTYRSNAKDKDGKEYKNYNGEPYLGSVCDSCEVAGRKYWHHPLRCKHLFPRFGFDGEAPEDNGDTSWWVRGGGTVDLSQV